MLLQLCSPPVLRFGGGPAVNHLYVCSICQVEIEALAKRRRVEIDTFIKVGAGAAGSSQGRALSCWGGSPGSPAWPGACSTGRQLEQHRAVRGCLLPPGLVSRRRL